MSDKPFTQPLILIWGAGKDSKQKIGTKNLLEKREDIKACLETYYKDQHKEVVVAYSEDEIWKKFTDNLKRFGASDISGPETKQVEWSNLIICLDDPRIFLTVQSEITGILLPCLTYPWRERPEFLRKVVIFEPDCFLKEEAGIVTTAGSVSLARVVEARERLGDIIEPIPYTEEQFEKCDLRNEVLRVISALEINEEIKDLDIE